MAIIDPHALLRRAEQEDSGIKLEAYGLDPEKDLICIKEMIVGVSKEKRKQRDAVDKKDRDEGNPESGWPRSVRPRPRCGSAPSLTGRPVA